MILVIGTKAIWHDSAVFIYNTKTKDIFAMPVERITRYKHDYIYPLKVLEKFLEYSKINRNEIKKVIISHSFDMFKEKKIGRFDYEKEILLRKALNARYLKEYFHNKKNRTFRYNFDSLKYIYYRLLNTSVLLLEDFTYRIKKTFPKADIKNYFFDHQLCHAISSYVSSKFDKALCITMDGQGDYTNFSSIYLIDKKFSIKEIVKNNSNIRNFNFNGFKSGCSIGGIYAYFTYFLGFTPNADEGKVEALAAFSKPIEEIYKFLDKNIKVNGIKIVINEKIIQNKLPYLLEKYKQQRKNLASTIQKFSEKIILKYVKNAVEKTGCQNICLAGGVFANVIINKKIFEKLSENIHIVPAMGDDGSSEGACYLAMLEEGMIDELKKIKENYNMPYFGTSYTKEEVRKILEKNKDKIKYKELGDDWYKVIAKMLVGGKIGALFRGRMEWGPRALGNRSIIARVNDPDIQKKMNKEIKRRPEFQPFCPSILIEEKNRLFKKAYNNKHMTIAFQMKEEHIKNIPSAVHIDGTARVQFVSKEDNEAYYNLIKEVKNLTGYGVIINTSFNKHGRTIVESPQNAITDFLDTDMDYLFIEGFLVERKN